MAYIDHNTLQTGFENADDHRYIQSIAKKHGMYFSRPGNGICHQVHLERFGMPGKTLIGSDSHTPTGGGIGMLAIGAGGLDVAVAMGGGAYYITMPKIVQVKLTGALRPWCGGQGCHPGGAAPPDASRAASARSLNTAAKGVETLSVPERATITNMGAELGATTSIFPSDEVTRALFDGAGPRRRLCRRLRADADAVYDEVHRRSICRRCEPLAACPHMPRQRQTGRGALAASRWIRCCIGSCTNSSLYGYAEGGRHAQGQDGRPERQPRHRAGLQAGA